MKKNSKVLQQRKDLIELAINDPKKAAKYFEFAALSLKQARTTTQIIDILANTLFLNERTVSNQIEKTT